ncbi:diacylglycerol kinase family protein [Thalassobacillus sp. CUG 92003]|uniref:diacylglycerol/lipid kinase family protein n=1 Tax=Thalassobacillus sp. CUG 92003 TaxID=2736641 RepID=UPI0015E76FAE|nr:YegS/Rv2252/BmrU family lipid kinase [Thalassobacillus sp. CUG 92003]
MPRYERGILIYNGNAGGEDIEMKLSQSVPVLAQEIKHLHLLQTKSIDEFKDACRTHAEEVDLMLVLGGDGTIHECINVLATMESPPVVGVLPGGTCNDFSRMLNLPQNIQQAANALIQGSETRVDVGKLGEEYFINFWGIGLVTEASFNIDKQQKSRFGVLSYFMSALKTMNQVSPFSFKMTIDGETIEDEAVMIVVMNGRFIGTRQIPIPSISSDDGKLDVLVVKNSNLKLFREILAMNQPWTAENNFEELAHKQAERIEITTEPVQELDMDGEIDGETPSTITVLPRHLTFLENNTSGFN